MPKTIEEYECTICGQRYSTYESCEYCESQHCNPDNVEIDKIDYEPQAYWPKKLALINTTNGKKQVYVKA